MSESPAVEPSDSESVAKRILVIEEDRVEGGLLAFHLRRESLVVMLMASEEEALDAIAWATPDAVMVEAKGHGLDGFALLAQLKDSSCAPFLMTDGPLSLDDELRALALGVVDVFTKPLDPAMVAARLRARARPPVRLGPFPDLPPGGIVGDLDVHPLPQLLQLSHRHRMNARLHVEMNGDWAVLLVRQGEVIDAETPDATGRDAVGAALQAAAGAFVLFPLELTAEDLNRDDVVHSDVASLVTEALGRKTGKHPRPERRRRSVAHSTVEYESSPSGRKRTPSGAMIRRRKQLGIPTRAAERHRPKLTSTDPERRPVPLDAVPPAAPQVNAEQAPPPPTPVRPTAGSAAAPSAAPSNHTPSGGSKQPSSDEAERPTPVPNKDIDESTPRPPIGMRRRVSTSAAADAVRATTGRSSKRAGDAPPGDEAEPEGPQSARIRRPEVGAPSGSDDGAPRANRDDGGLDEPTDVQEISPLSGSRPRVRRPRTGVFAIGDSDAPSESTDVDFSVDADLGDFSEFDDFDDEDTSIRLLRGRGRWSSPGVIGLGLATAAAIVFVAWRLLSQPGAPPATPAAAPDPEFLADVEVGRALQAIKSGRWTEAEDFLRDTQAGTNPHTQSVLGAARARVALASKTPAAGGKQLESLRRLNPDDPYVMGWLGVLSAQAGDGPAARDWFKKAGVHAPEGLFAERLKQLGADSPAPPSPEGGRAEAGSP